jgi:hypothetical protein
LGLGNRSSKSVTAASSHLAGTGVLEPGTGLAAGSIHDHPAAGPINPRADRARQLHSGVAIGSAGSADTKRYVRDPDPSATRISFRALEEAGIS